MSRFDYTFEETESLENLKRLILGNFETRGFRQIHLSAFESVETFVEQKGENVRQKIFTLNGETDAELCLRPELTVPACKFFLNSLAGSMDRCRLCYEGLVWRMNPVEPGFYSEFTQAGVELIGDYPEVSADTEILELAVETLVRCGISISQIVVNDVRILKHLFAELGIGQKRQSQIEQALIRGDGIDDLPVGPSTSVDSSDLFDQVLQSVGPDNLSEFLVEILSLQGNSYGPNSRSARDVADRLIRKKTNEENELTPRQLDVLSEALDISGAPKNVSERLKKLAAANQFQEAENFGALVDLLVDKTQLLGSALSVGQPPEIEWDLGFQRSFKYYSGLIFDINSNNGAMCGGGRYDNLLTQIGSQRQLKAAGFAIGIDRLLHEQRKLPASRLIRKAIVAVLEDPGVDGSETNTRYKLIQQSFAIAKEMRQANWATEIECCDTGRQPILADAKKSAVDLIAWVSQGDFGNGKVTLHQIDNDTETAIAVADLPAFLSRWRSSEGEA